MAIDLTKLANKIDNNDTDQGVLRADEFNNLVRAVIDNQNDLKGVVKGVKFGTDGEVAIPNDKGIVTIKTDVTDTYKFSFLSPDESYKDILEYIESFPSYILAGQSYNVKVRISFTERFNDVDTSIKDPLKINFKVGSDIAYTTSIYDFNLKDNLINDNEKTISFNFANYLVKNSINDCSIEVFDTAEYPRINPKVIKLNKVFVVNASCNIKLEGTKNNLNIYDTSSLLNDDSNIVVTTTSSSGKVNIFHKDSNIDTLVFTIDNITSTTSRIKLTTFDNIIRKHGTHTIYATLEYTIPGTDDTLNIVSNELSYIFYDNTITSEDPLVSINKVSTDLVFKEYNNVMLSYLAYLPKNYVPGETKEERSLKIETTKQGDSTVIISRSYEIVPEQLTDNILTGNISYLLSNTADKTKQLDSGKYEMSISFGNYYSKMNIEIEHSPINLENFNITGQQVYFKSADKSPGDTAWSYTFEDTINNISETYNVKFNNFDFTEYGSSFKTDTSLDGGQTVLNIKRNSSIEIPYPIFAKPLELESAVGGSPGKTISIEFKTYNCISQVKPIITCIDMDVEEKDRVGFIVYPNKIIVQSKSGSKFEAKFKEDEQIKLDIVIEGNYKEYYNPTVSGTKGEDVAEGEDAKSSEALIIIYINGVYQRLHRILSTSDTYSEYLKDGSYVTNNCPIVIGSEGCDIDLYSVKLYEKPLISRDIVYNYGFDTPRFEDRIAIISRNIIWSENPDEKSKLHDIVRKDLETHLPNLPIFSFEMHESNADALPVDKSNWKFLTKSKYFNYNIQDGNSDTGNISFYVNSAALRNQGTSSMNYPMPWRNWDWKPDIDVAIESGALKEDDPKLSELSKKFHNYNYNTVVIGEKWKQYDNMPKGIRKFTFKKDYASSEMCNNAVCSALFTDMAIIAGPKFKGVLEPTGSLNKYGHRLSLIATPCFMYQELTGENKGKTKTLGMMNLIPNKNETDYLGLGDTDTRKWDLLKILEIDDIALYTGESTVPRAQAWEVSENHVIWDKKYESYSINDAMAYPENYKGVICYLYDTVEVNFNNLFNKENKDLAKTTLVDTISSIKNSLQNIGEDYSDDGLLAFEYYIVTDQNKKYVFIKVSDKNADDKGKEGYVFEPKIELFGTYINSILNNYEARYPKDSSAVELGPNEDINVWGEGKEADFGFAPSSDWMFSDKKTIVGSLEFTQADVIKAETRDILRFHNWLVDCHPAKCVDGATIKIETDGIVENVPDTPANRLNKFKTEAANYLILDQWILYYIWRELFWMFDSGSKNLQIYTIDGIHWGCMVRDADTALGIDNLGVETFPPYLEDTDFYTSVNGEEFFFDKAAGKYSIGQLENTRAKAVLNGQFGSIWLNLRDSYKDEIEDMAKYLLSSSNNKLTAKETINAFDSHQDKWCESLYNFGMRQYFGGELFYKWISSGNGNKRLSRKDWLTKAFDYRLGKYKCYSDDGRYHINWRATKLNLSGVTTNEEFEFKFYQPCYILSGGSTFGIAYTSEDCYKRITTFGDESTNVPIYGWGFPGDGNSESNTYFYGVHNITDFGPLYKTVELHDFNPNKALLKITKLEFGNKTWSKDNRVEYGLKKPLLLNSMTKLQYLDITNHHALNIFEVNGCSQLEELYMSGTDSLTEVVLPKTKTLHTIHFGKSIKILRLDDLVGIKDVKFDGYSNLIEFTAKNCSDYIKKESYNIVMNSPKLAKADLDIEWGKETPIDVTDILNLLDKDINLRGVVYVKSMTFSQKLQLMSKFGEIDINNGINNLRVICNQLNEVTGISVNPSVLYAGTIGSLYNVSFAPNNDKGNNMLRVTWSVKSGPFNQYFYVIDENGNKTTINNALGNLTIERYGEIVEEPLDGQYVEDVVLTASMRTFKYVNGEIKENTDLLNADITIKLYNRDARPGDIVYSDGTYLSAKDHNNSKEVIGICFYVEQKNKDGYYGKLTDDVSKQRTTPLRLMITSNLSHAIISSQYPFGLHTSLNNELDFINGSVTNTFNIQSIEDVASSIASFSDWSNYKTAEGGWRYGAISSTTENKPYAIGQIDPFEKNGIIYSYGEFNTNEIIKHRNTILEVLKVKTPQEIYQENIDANPYYTYTEYDVSADCLNRAKDNEHLITQISPNDNSLLKLVYYPQASLCYAFEPSVKNKSILLDKFKKHNWFIGSGGEVIRLAYYINVYNNDRTNANNNPDNIFYNIVNKNIIPNLEILLTSIVGRNVSTSSENNNNQYITLTDWNAVTFSSIASQKDYDDGTKQIIPMCKF